MTALETFDPDIIPGFDVLEWKREIQEEFYQATKDMTSEEFLAYMRKGNDKIREERRLRQGEQS
jgi:hypothetical protein